MQRRQFLQQGFAAMLLAGQGAAGLSLSQFMVPGKVVAKEYSAIPLPIPPLLEAAENNFQVGLDVQSGSRSFFPGTTTPTLGFSGPFLGPTIRARDGDPLRIIVDNKLQESTTVHWHGLHVPAQWDGGPRQVIGAGSQWRPDFTIRQQAATLWYHPHALGRTGEHVYRGLAGLFLIDDDFSDRCPVPKDYGIDDIPVILQDRRFYEDGRFAYVTSGHDIMHGVVGNYLLVNGALEPRLTVQRGLMRFRMLNGSNSSIYRLSFGDNRTFFAIASDGGFLETPVELDSLVFTAGERYEILVDFGGDEVGAKTAMMVEQWGGRQFRALTLTVGEQYGRYRKIPATLRSLDRLEPATAVRTRRFEMQTVSRGGRLTINGRTMSIDRIDATVKRGTTEIWELVNNSRMMMQLPHSMHLHDVQFQLLDRNGEPPRPLESGRKDTVLLMPGETVRIIVAFGDYTGIYMFHCHMLEHEDHGMMGQFEVI